MITVTCFELWKRYAGHFIHSFVIGIVFEIEERWKEEECSDSPARALRSRKVENTRKQKNGIKAVHLRVKGKQVK